MTGALSNRYTGAGIGRQPVDNVVLKDLEVRLPPRRAEELRRAASSYKASAGLGTDCSFIQGSLSLDLSVDTFGKIMKFLAKVGQCRHLEDDQKINVSFAVAKFEDWESIRKWRSDACKDV